MPCTEAGHEGSNAVEDRRQVHPKNPYHALKNRTLNARFWISFMSQTTMLDGLLKGQPDEIKPSNATSIGIHTWNA